MRPRVVLVVLLVMLGFAPAAMAAAPVNSSPPVVSGTAQQGQTLTTSNGAWTGTVTSYKYSWYDCNGTTCSAVSGATAKTYTLQASDVGLKIRSGVKACNTACSAVVKSAATATVTASSGGGVLGGDQTVEANSDTNQAGNPQAWRVDGMNAGTAQSIAFYVAGNDAATSMSVGLYADNGGHPGSLVAQGSLSSLTKNAWNTVQLVSQPTLNSGTYWIAAVGTGGALGFQDRVSGSCNTEVSSQGGLSSLPSSWSTGQVYTNSFCPVSAYVNGGSALPAPPANTSSPTVSGTPQQGSTLTADPGTWTGNPAPSFTYQWQQDGVNVSGATSKTYVPSAGDVGHQLDVVVTGTNSQGMANATSASVGPVTAQSSSQPVGDPLGRNWTAVFGDEFNGTSIDSSKWTSLNFWYLNNANVSPADCSESGGNLILSLPGDGTGCDLATDQNGLDSYGLPVGGYLEARVYFPGTSGGTNYNFPAVWALGNAPSGGSGEHGGEIDFAEGVNPLQINYHSDTADTFVAAPAGSWVNSWHVYGVYRGATQDQIFWDGNLVGTVQTADDGSPESIMLTSGETGGCCGGPVQHGSAGNVLVDWVHAWN